MNYRDFILEEQDPKWDEDTIKALNHRNLDPNTVTDKEIDDAIHKYYTSKLRAKYSAKEAVLLNKINANHGLGPDKLAQKAEEMAKDKKERRNKPEDSKKDKNKIIKNVKVAGGVSAGVVATGAAAKIAYEQAKYKKWKKEKPLLRKNISFREYKQMMKTKKLNEEYYYNEGKIKDTISFAKNKALNTPPGKFIDGKVMPKIGDATLTATNKKYRKIKKNPNSKNHQHSLNNITRKTGWKTATKLGAAGKIGSAAFIAANRYLNEDQKSDYDKTMELYNNAKNYNDKYRKLNKRLNIIGSAGSAGVVGSRIYILALTKKLNKTINPKQRKKLEKQIKALKALQIGSTAVSLGGLVPNTVITSKSRHKTSKYNKAAKEYNKKYVNEGQQEDINRVHALNKDADDYANKHRKLNKHLMRTTAIGGGISVASSIYLKRLIKKLNKTKNPKEKAKIEKQIKLYKMVQNGGIALTVGSAIPSFAIDAKNIHKNAKVLKAEKQYRKKYGNGTIVGD